MEHNTLEAIRQLREMGAVYVKIGDTVVGFNTPQKQISTAWMDALIPKEETEEERKHREEMENYLSSNLG